MKVPLGTKYLFGQNCNYIQALLFIFRAYWHFRTVLVLVSTDSFVPKGTYLLTKFNSGKPKNQKNVPSFARNGHFFIKMLRLRKTGGGVMIEGVYTDLPGNYHFAEYSGVK